MQWMIEEDRLGPEQKEIINDMHTLKDKAVWIQGHAGSGKSIVLLHALTEFIIRNPKSNVVVVVFTLALVDLLKSGLKQIPALVDINIPVITIYKLNKLLHLGQKFDAIFCDEVQDIPMVLLKRMKNGSNKLIIAGDAAQSIYTSVPIFNERPCSKTEIITELDPEVKTTKTIYRLTRSIIKVLMNVYNDLFADLVHIGREDSEIRLFKANDYFKEIEFSWKESKQINIDRTQKVHAVLFFQKNDLIKYVDTVLNIEGKKKWTNETYPDYSQESRDLRGMNKYLNEKNIPLMYVGNGIGSLDEANQKKKIILMTYHSSKGLDFDSVSLPCIQTDLGSTENENAIILVALTRAKSQLLITFTGSMSSGFKKFLKNTSVKNINDLKIDSDEVIF